MFAGDCSDKFWDSFGKLSKDEQLWNRMNDNPLVTEYRGYVISTSSKSLYSPSNCQRYEQGEPLPTLRNNELDILRDGQLVAKTYWLGGVVIVLKIQRLEGSKLVQILAGELHYAIWQRNGKPIVIGDILSKNILLYKLVWRGVLPE
jgi:hypothetical protein